MILEFTEREMYDLLGYKYYQINFTTDLKNRYFTTARWDKNEDLASKSVYDDFILKYSSVYISSVGPGYNA